MPVQNGKTARLLSIRDLLPAAIPAIWSSLTPSSSKKLKRENTKNNTPDLAKEHVEEYPEFSTCFFQKEAGSLNSTSNFRLLIFFMNCYFFLSRMRFTASNFPLTVI